MATGLVGLSSKKTASILESIQPFGDLRFLALVRTRQPKQSRAAHTLPVRDLKGLSHPVTFSSLVLFSGSARNSRRNFQLIDSDRFIQSKTIPISKDLSTPDMHSQDQSRTYKCTLWSSSGVPVGLGHHCSNIESCKAACNMASSSASSPPAWTHSFQQDWQ